MSNLIFRTGITAFALFCLGCNSNTNHKPEHAAKPNAAVVTARKEASEIGLQILAKGGNAFDAMVATHAALAVAYPYAGNIGGGGFMVYRTADGAYGALDFREKAPMAATRDMYLDENGNVIQGASTKGALAVGIPGSVDALFKVNERFGTMTMDRLLEPSINLAKKGVIVTQKQSDKLNEYREAILSVNKNVTLLSAHFKQGDTIKHRSLANTLSRIAMNGRSEFYEGETAQKLVSFIQSKGGIITLADLAAYESVWRNPVSFSYDDLNIISMPPPSSGGICLAQIMELIEPFDLHTMSYQGDSMIQLISEAERLSYADRAEYLGDPDFVTVPKAALVDEQYLTKRFANFSFGKAGRSDTTKAGLLPVYESDETTHYSIVDQWGNAVSVTTTINSAYGSKLYDTALGFFYNNEMDDFSAKPGVPNLYGLIGNEANAIEPQKRMLSSMTPTIIEKDEKLWMVLGTPGGSRIITSVLQTILNVHEYGMDMQAAVDAPRFHHQWLPDEIMMEQERFPFEVKEVLRNKGYSINQVRAPIQGKVDAILVLPDGTLQTGADFRGDDYAASGYLTENDKR